MFTQKDLEDFVEKTCANDPYEKNIFLNRIKFIYELESDETYCEIWNRITNEELGVIYIFRKYSDIILTKREAKHIFHKNFFKLP